MLELIVVVSIIGIVAGLSGLALASLKAPRELETTRLLRTARIEAIRTGLPASFRVPNSAQRILFLPDGRALGRGVDPLTGSPNDSAR